MSDEPVYDDVDPEDAYDEGDPFEDKLDVLERAIDDIRTRMDGRRESRRILVDELIDGMREQVDIFRGRVAALREALDAL